MPSRRVSSASGTPASASFNTRTICSSLNRLFLMVLLLSGCFTPEKLHFRWTKFRGALSQVWRGSLIMLFLVSRPHPDAGECIRFPLVPHGHAYSTTPCTEFGLLDSIPDAPPRLTLSPWGIDRRKV